MAPAPRDARPLSKTQATTPKRVPPKPKHGSYFFRPNRPAFEPIAGGCAVRTLTGAELQARKRELELRDRQERRAQT